jgi:hypothetical protein
MVSIMLCLSVVYEYVGIFLVILIDCILLINIKFVIKYY